MRRRAASCVLSLLAAQLASAGTKIPLRATRESDAFVESTRVRWNRFTERLRELAEQSE